MKAQNWTRYQVGRDTMSKLVIPAFEEIGRTYTDKEALNLGSCGRFVYAAECVSCTTRHFTGHNKCRSRWCISCNHARTLAWIARLLPILEAHIDSGGYVTLMTITVKDEPILIHQLNRLNKGWRILQHEDKTLRKKFKARFPGGLRSMETKIGKNSGQWHGHYHCMMLQTSYEKDSKWLIPAWKQITATIGTEGSIWLNGYDKKNGLLKATIETVKYIMKPEREIYTNTDNLHEAYMTLKGKRQVNTWGTLRKLLREADIEAEAMQDDAQKKLTDFICQKCGCSEAELVTLLYNELQSDDVLYDYISKNE